MLIKNYSSKTPAIQSIANIQKQLVSHGASSCSMRYEKGTGRISALEFSLTLDGNEVNFRLPVEWLRFQEVLKQQKVSKWRDEEYCYRVAWKNIHDWVTAQMALYETMIVTIPQIFLPYAVLKNGNTLFEEVALNPKLLLN